MKRRSKLFGSAVVTIVFFLTAMVGGCGSNQGESKNTNEILSAIRGPEADVLAGETGVYIVFIQREDGKAVSSVDQLDTFYFLASQPGCQMGQTLVFQTDTDLKLERYRLVGEPWMQRRVFRPSDIPDVDLDKAYSKVKEMAGDLPISNISISIPLEETVRHMVIYTLKNPDGHCEEYLYEIESGNVSEGMQNVACLFDIHAGVDPCEK